MRELFVIIACFLPFATHSNEWLKGDLHVHSKYSGGDSTVSELASAAKLRGLDFIAITDHDNKMGGVPKAWGEISKNTSSTVLIYGMEWTRGVNWMNCHGHMNIWSASPFDYENIWRANELDDSETAMSGAREQNAIYSINHPYLFGFEWEYDFPKTLPAMEIWNGMFELGASKRSISEAWNDYLLKGVRVTGVGGSDVHDLKGKKSPLHTMGNPTTWVYAKNRDASSVLDAVKRGNALISFDPNSQVAYLKADADGDGVFEAMSGDNVIPKGKIISLKIELISSPGNIVADSVVLFKNGAPYRSWRMNGQKNILFSDFLSNSDRAFYVLELHGKTWADSVKALLYGDLLSISNPITVRF